eukprot:3236300-Pyramimonas_sp.AAC.1
MGGKTEGGVSPRALEYSPCVFSLLRFWLSSYTYLVQGAEEEEEEEGEKAMGSKTGGGRPR